VSAPARTAAPVRIGITLPSFRHDPGPVVAVAREAEEAGLDGVFLFDHMFRLDAAGRPRPAHELGAMLGAVVAATSTITVGSLVARATLRPAAVLAAMFASARRIGGDRLVAGLGVGDRESLPEHDQFGPPFASLDARLAQLRAAAEAIQAVGVPVWIGGRHARVQSLAFELADGWNRWGGSAADLAETLATDLGALEPRRRERFATSWGGVVDLRTTTPEELRSLLATGMHWVIVGPRHPEDPDSVRRLRDLVAASR
jgi:alkanesulfonate monooxygenase SsuD/methylene tetrahydromethanopterin reductase-like flavin-dependent oxidoreductase (luciferase family)